MEDAWVRLNFENCEVLEIPRKYVVSVNLIGVSRNISVTSTYIDKHLLCSEAFIMISKKYLESNYMDENLYGSGVSLLDKILLNDLVSVSFSEEPEKEFYVPYQGDDENEYEAVVTGNCFKASTDGEYVAILVSENPSNSFSEYLSGGSPEDFLAINSVDDEGTKDTKESAYFKVKPYTNNGVELSDKLDAVSDKLDKLYERLSGKPTKEDWENVLKSADHGYYPLQGIKKALDEAATEASKYLEKTVSAYKKSVNDGKDNK